MGVGLSNIDQPLGILEGDRLHTFMQKHFGSGNHSHPPPEGTEQDWKGRRHQIPTPHTLIPEKRDVGVVGLSNLVQFLKEVGGRRCRFPTVCIKVWRRSPSYLLK